LEGLLTIVAPSREKREADVRAPRLGGGSSLSRLDYDCDHAAEDQDSIYCSCRHGARGALVGGAQVAGGVDDSRYQEQCSERYGEVIVRLQRENPDGGNEDDQRLERVLVDPEIALEIGIAGSRWRHDAVGLAGATDHYAEYRVLEQCEHGDHFEFVIGSHRRHLPIVVALAYLIRKKVLGRD